MFVGDYVFFIIASISIITVFFVCFAYMMFTYAKEVVYYRNTKFIEYFFKGVGLGLLCNLATCFVLLFVALCCSLRLEAWNYLGKFLKHETFLIILYLGKIIALASIGSAVVNTIYIYFTADSMPLFAASLIFTAVIIVRHKKNLIRIMNKEENKITWM